MAIAASNPFSVGIRVPPTSSTPTVQDERDTYTLWGWTWNEATANPAYNSAPGYVISNPDIHGDTEGDDVWAYLQAYNRRTTGRDGYLQRAQAWRNYYVNTYEGSAAQSNEAGFGYDHITLWGLQEYADQFSDLAAAAQVITMLDDQYDWWSTYGGAYPNWPVAGSYSMAYWGARGQARTLLGATAVADATGNAHAIELRDRFIDLWIQSPDWDDARGMYWVSETQFQSYGFEGSPWNLDYTAGDRVMSDFHLGILANAFYTAWSSPNVTPARKNALKTKLIKMALFIRTYGVDPTNQLSGHYIGWNGGENRVWHSQSIEFFNPVTFWDTSHGIALVNLLVIGYKFTGDRAYLDGTPTVATPGVFPAKYVFNRHTKGIYGNPATRECADNVVGHFQDTKFSLPGEQMLAYNKGEFQYTYLIFENGGAPTVSL